MKKPSELIDEATKAGCTTIAEYVEWSYTQGQKDTYDEVVNDFKAINKEVVPELAVNVTPDYMNKAIAEGVENER